MAQGGHIQWHDKPSQGQRQFDFPETMRPHIKKVLEGEYDIPWSGPGLCLDIGANVGAFTVYAKMKWPELEVDAYEPNPEMVKLLKKNVEGMKGVTVHESAVGDPELDKLYLGKHNPGESSQYQNGIEQTDNAIEIEVTDPESLLSYDVVKMDCEGAEKYILARLDLSQTKFVMFEYHSEHNRRACDDILCMSGFTLIKLDVTSRGYGVAKYQRF